MKPNMFLTLFSLIKNKLKNLANFNFGQKKNIMLTTPFSLVDIPKITYLKLNKKELIKK